MNLRNKVMIPILIVLILSFAGIGVATILSINKTVDSIVGSQMRSIADTVSGQIAQTDKVVAITLDSLDKKNVALAHSLARMIDEDISNLEPKKMTELAKFLNVDEVHVTDEKGVLLWGNVPGFYGFSFGSGEQTIPFLDILTNPKVELAQAPTPRDTDGVMFQYTGVTRLDQPGIVQVGTTVEAINEIRNSMSLQHAIEGLKIGQSGGVYVLDADRIVTADSTNNLLGIDGNDYAWTQTMYENKTGNITYQLNERSIYAYYQQAGEQMVVVWIPRSELQGYTQIPLIAVVSFGVAAALILTVLLIVLFKRFITVPLNEVVGASEKMAAGDMNIQLSVRSNDEIGKLTTSFQNMLNSTQSQITVLESLSEGDLTPEVVLRGTNDAMGMSMKKIIENLGRIFSEINYSTAQVSVGSKQIADGSQALAQGSTQQSAAVEQLSTSVSEMAHKTQENVDMARRAASLGETIKVNAEKGSGQMDQMMSAVREINEASQSIGKVIKVIDDIAFQTNILALNASVEAARAGQHGKGFAVVADEVRSLAAKSAEAAKDTGSLIANSMEKAELGARIADETAKSLAEIVSGIGESSKIVDGIAQSSEEQSAAVTQINRGIDQVAQVVQQNSTTAEESAAASVEMSGQSDTLEELVSQFKLKTILS